MSVLDKQLLQWADGIASEANFWRNWFATKGGAWSDDYAKRMSPDSKLTSLIRSKLLGMSRKARILDVGAGPISAVGYTDPEIEFELVPCDPLAPIYQSFYSEFDATPPVPTVFAPGEDLSAIFSDDKFDLVYCQNALDHSFDPVRILQEMLRITEVGGHIILFHRRNEAEHENYAGFHQFNLDVIDGEFVIWNRDERSVPEIAFRNFASFSQKLEGEWVTVEIQKTREMPDNDSFQRTAKRLGSVWEAVILALSHRALHSK